MMKNIKRSKADFPKQVHLSGIITAGLAAAPLATQAGGDGGDGGDGGSGFSNTQVTQSQARSLNHSYRSQGYQVTSSFNNSGGMNYSVDLGGYSDNYSTVGESSTPFLTVWCGQEYVHENDFLFGKPNTAFANYESGLAAYEKGIGGDTYLLSQNLVPDEEGNLRLQIREIEPEESYIDQLSLLALDLKESERYVVDGNLVDDYVFNTKETQTVSNQTVKHYHKKQDAFTNPKLGYSKLEAEPNRSEAVLEKDDELIIRVPKSSLNPNTDTFILVDSYYRDWSLGDQVPFSTLERFSIGSAALGRNVVTTVAGVAILCTSVLTGITDQKEDDSLRNILNTPQAEAAHVQGGGGSGGYLGGYTRSLIVSVQANNTSTYLQTLFPRYVQSSAEVVKIPKEIIKYLKDEFLTVRVRATKRHKVTAAFVFSGTSKKPHLTPLNLQSAVSRRDNQDHAKGLAEKNSGFLHTVPGDVVDVVIKDSPRPQNTIRRYVLKANGFYTRLSKDAYRQVGRNWLDKLAASDRQLLKRLRTKV